MGKTKVENLDLKSKLSIVSGTIANVKKDIESFKNEFNYFKSDHAISKKGLNSLNNEFFDYLIKSLKVNYNLVKIDNDILMTKNEYYVNIRNKGHIINNDMLINKTKCIKLKSVVRENINSLKNIKNNLYNVKKDTDSLSIDLKKLKEEHINKSNKRVKVRSILVNIKVNRFNKRFNRFNKRFNRFINKPSSKTNARTIKDSAIVKKHVDDLIVKNHVDACTNTDNLIFKNQVDACTSTDDLIVKNHVNVCTSTDDLCTNENEPCTNENENENENEQCTNESDDSESDDDDDNESDDNDDNKPGNNDNKDNKLGNNDNKDDEPGDNDNKETRHMNFVILLKKQFLNNITKIIELVNESNDEIYANNQWLVFAQLNKINSLIDELKDRVWLIIYNKKREKNEIINTGVDKDKDIEGYVHIYNKIVGDKLEFMNKISELIDNAIKKKDFRNLKDDALAVVVYVMLKEKSVRKIIKKKIVMIANIIIVIMMMIIIIIKIMLIIIMIMIMIIRIII